MDCSVAASSAGIAEIGGATVANGSNADRLSGVGQLVEDPISPHTQRVQPAQFASERVSRVWLTLKQAQRILDRVDQ
jgi:hypothetical protein